MTETYNGTTYICSSGTCTNHAPNDGWEELSVDLSALDDIEDILDGFGGTNQPATVKGYVSDRIGTLGTVIVDGDVINARNVAEKIGTEITGTNKTVAGYIAGRLGFTGADADKTVAKYIEDYVSEYAASGGVQVKTVGDDTYICSENCDMANTPPCSAGTESTCGWQKLEVNLTEYLKSSVAASTYVASAGLKLVRVGADIKLQQVSGGTVVKDYGVIAGVQDLMCASYRTEQVSPGQDGCPASGSMCYKMICNTVE